MRYFLAVDGGGSKTEALLVDETGRTVGEGRGGPGNYHMAGLDGAMRAIQQAITSALQGRTPTASCFCLAAADMPHDFAELRRGLATLNLPGDILLYNDVISIFRAGSRFSYGVGVVCGTGFGSGGIGKDGQEIRFPALGDFTGDCAGGAYIAMQAVFHAFRAWDGRGEPTLLQEAILQRWNAESMDTLAERWVQGKISHDDINTLAPLVFEMSVQGDAVAQSILRHQGVELATAAAAILKRLDLLETDCDVVLGGSVFYGVSDLLIKTLTQTLQQKAPLAQARRLTVAPVVGAALLASDHAGVEASFQEALFQQLPALYQRQG